MVGKAQKSHGAKSGLYGRCSNGVPPIKFSQAEQRIQFRSRPCDFWALPAMKWSSEARNFEVINGLQHVFEKWVERCKKCIACQERCIEKETVTAVYELCKRPSVLNIRVRHLFQLTEYYHYMLLVVKFNVKIVK
jgi:hypothetical protein